MDQLWPRLRSRTIRLALQYPPVTGALVFLFLLTVSNHVYFGFAEIVEGTSFSHMLVMGALMASFGSLLLGEAIRLTRRVSELESAHTIAHALLYEIKNPVQVIQLLAEQLQEQQSHDREKVGNILAHGGHIIDSLTRLSELQARVLPSREAGLAGPGAQDRMQ